MAETVTLHTPTIGLVNRAVFLARDIKLSHSVFALPFAVLAAFLAASARRSITRRGFGGADCAVYGLGSDGGDGDEPLGRSQA